MMTLGVKEIWQENERSLAVIWTDQKKSVYDVVKLRELCPCAECLDEFSRIRKHPPGKSFEEVRPTRIQSIGSYALKIEFNDGHRTGIYPFDLLRSWDQSGVKPS